LDSGAYPVEVYFIDEVKGNREDAAAVAAFILERTEEEYDVRLDPTDAACTLRAGSLILVLAAADEDPIERAVSLAHEALHVVSYVWLVTKQKMSAKHDEPMAYLLAHIFRQLLEGEDE
jgi:hypothetical protein